MAGKNSNFDDIRRTGDEAQRLLRDFEESVKDEINPPGTTKAKLYPSTTTSTNSDQHEPWGEKSANPLLLTSIFVLIVLPIFVVAWQSNSSLSRNNSMPNLQYRASCGSKYSATGRWWPVLGPSSRSLLSRVKRDYCGDAYINAEGAVQVASFGSRQLADKFSKQITDAMQVSFRVGRGR